MDLSDRRRRDRIQLASQVVLKLSNAIDVLKDIKEKRDVANDVVIFIDANKDHLVQTVLRQDLNDLSECVYHRPPDDEGEDLSAAILLQTCSRNFQQSARFLTSSGILYMRLKRKSNGSCSFKHDNKDNLHYDQINNQL